MTEEIRLLKSSIKGDTTAFEKIVCRYQAMICAITFSGTGRVDISEDLAQETFFNAWKNLGQLKDLGGFRAWLCAIARNVLHNHYRQKKTVSLDASDPETFCDASENPSETLIHEEELVMLEQAIMRIPVEYREPLVMFYRQHQSTRQVAESLGLNESTVRTRLHRARQMLREEIAGRLERTIEQTAPGKTFTKAVMAGIGAGLAAGAAGTAAAAATVTGTAVTGTSASTGLATAMSTVTAKIIIIAVVAVVSVGAIFVYKHISQAAQLSVQSHEIASDHEEEPVVRSVNTEPTLPDIREVAADLAEVSASQLTDVPTNLDSRDPTRAEPSLILQPTEILEHSEYQFKPRGVLSGLVTNKDTGEPVVDAEIIIYGVSIPNGRLATDANGFYSLETVEQSKPYEIAITSKEYIGKPDIDDNYKIILEKEKQQVAHFQLEKACLVDLWVKDEQANPLKGASITVIDLLTNQATAMSRSSTFKSTDKDGYMRIGGHPVSKAGYMVMITHEPDFAPAHFIVKNTDPDIITAFTVTLKKGKSINGYIEYSDGVPAADLKIVAETDWWSTTNQSGQRTDISSDGTFTLAHITPEKYCISAFYPVQGNYKQIRTIDFAQHEGDLRITLSEPSPQSLLTIRGKVKVIKKAPVGNLYISIRSYNTTTQTHGTGTSVWDYDENNETAFEIGRLTEGNYTLFFESEHFNKVTLENVQPPLDDIYVVMEQIVKPEIEVKVVDKATGKPVTNMKARLIKTAYKDNPYGVTDQWLERSNPQGRAFFTVTPGVYQVHIMADGYALGISKDIDTNDSKPVTIELTKGGAIKGRVINPAGHPVAGAEILALSYAGSYSAYHESDFITKTKAVASDANGNFVIDTLPEGLETIKAVYKDYSPSIVRDIAVIDGKVHEGVIIQLKAAAVIEGYVYDNNSNVIANTRLDYDQNRDWVITRQNTEFVMTDPNGYYRIEGLAEDSYYIARNRGSFTEGVCSRTITPVCGEVTRLDFGGDGHVVTGTVMVGDVPSAHVKLALRSNTWEQFLGYAMTDTDGHFMFTGVVEGKYNIKLVDDFHTTLASVDVVDTDVDLGVIGNNLVDFEVVIAPVQGWETLQQVGVTSSSTYVLASQRDELDRQRGLWRLVDIAPGTYDLSILNDKATVFTVKINVEKEQAEPFIIIPPKLDATITGLFYQSISKKTMPRYILVSNDEKTVSAVLTPHKDGLPEAEGEFEVKLPEGHYQISYTDGKENKLLKEFDLMAGQQKRIEIDLSI